MSTAVAVVRPDLGPSELLRPLPVDGTAEPLEQRKKVRGGRHVLALVDAAGDPSPHAADRLNILEAAVEPDVAALVHIGGIAQGLGGEVVAFRKGDGEARGVGDADAGSRGLA